MFNPFWVQFGSNTKQNSQLVHVHQQKSNETHFVIKIVTVTQLNKRINSKAYVFHTFWELVIKVFILRRNRGKYQFFNIVFHLQ